MAESKSLADQDCRHAASPAGAAQIGREDRIETGAAVAGDETVQFELSAGLAIVRLNRPDKMNSLNEAMYQRLRTVLDELTYLDTVRAVYLTGNGRAFCAGQDLNERRQTAGGPAPDLSQTIAAKWNPLARALRYLPVPVVCAVNGVTAGAGVNLALNCDVVFAAQSARFILSFARIGLIPDAGGTYLLPRLIGPARAMAFALSGEPLDAPTAAQWGMIWRCVSDDALESSALDFARTLAQGPTLGLSTIKSTIWQSLDNSFEQQLELERREQGRCGFSHDYREGVSAFLEKRPAHFEGR